MNTAKNYPNSKSSFKPLFDPAVDYEPVPGKPAQANSNQMANDGPIPQGGGNYSNASDTGSSVPQGLYKPSIRY